MTSFAEALKAVESEIPRQPGQSDVRYALAIAQLEKDQRRRPGSRADAACEELRRVGRNILTLAKYETERDAVFLTKVYAFTAPLDACNWRCMRAPDFDAVGFANWLEVAALNESAKDVPNTQVLQWRTAALGQPDDPYAIVFAEIDAQVRGSPVPPCAAAAGRSVKAAYGLR
jgi:hypothetical protein